MIQYKEGVNIRGTCPEILEGQMVVNEVLAQYGYITFVTCGREGSHSWTSRHYDGRARDYRSKHIHRDMLPHVRNEIKSRLKPLRDFDFILEGLNGPNEHFHLEWQPKGER